jgi:hypothetical protein
MVGAVVISRAAAALLHRAEPSRPMVLGGVALLPVLPSDDAILLLTANSVLSARSTRQGEIAMLGAEGWTGTTPSGILPMGEAKRETSH